ncbi:hypothetical protein BG015_011736 [Linnemannia schmuckeri]|uniref:SH3 domain-containing protein n=1 Tax=Linnemannia schmuckeri TaxID=64567 RepID=A0A9P5VE70_9FUNG|nr:hypothetical protein BG015_011736 [Linnemannia schmuckeri]
MRSISPKGAIVAVAVLLAVIGTSSMPTTEAAPVANVADVQHRALDFGAKAQDSYDHKAIIIDNLRKRPATDLPPLPTSGSGRPTTTNGGGTNPTRTSNPPRPTSSAASSRPSASTGATRATTTNHDTTTRGLSTASGSSVPVVTGTGTSSAAGPDATTPNDSNVPTGVSKSVLIGLGTVGGFIVFALGGLAFCRHRKKKNLATALLQQTAQFNNNNPYAKLPEPAATPKESLPMTPTKPLGTYNVVATYTPALADEIEIGLGDSVTILQEYDDGWCMGVNNSRGGIKGVFPRHCVEMGPYEGSQHGAPGGPHYPPSPSFKATANKRMSSIAPASQGWNDGYQNGGNYPPQPNPQYPGPNSSHQGGGGGGYYNGGGGGGGY